MIPVRVPADAALHTVGGVRHLDPDHPLYVADCPLCDRMLQDHPITLVAVGIAPEHRKDHGWTTGAAVAVHTTCTLPTREPET